MTKEEHIEEVLITMTKGFKITKEKKEQYKKMIKEGLESLESSIHEDLNK